MSEELDAQPTSAVQSTTIRRFRVLGIPLPNGGLRQPWREGKAIRYLGYYFAALRTVILTAACHPDGTRHWAFSSAAILRPGWIGCLTGGNPVPSQAGQSTSAFVAVFPTDHLGNGPSYPRKEAPLT